LLGLSKKRKTKRPPIEYEEAKRVACADGTAARRDLASREDIQPEILYYLVDDESAEVRRRDSGQHGNAPPSRHHSEQRRRRRRALRSGS